MAWSNNGKGPWGKAPEPEQNQDFDDIIRKGREKLDDWLSGGDNNGRVPWIIGGVIFVLWLASGFFVLDAKEEGVVLRFGEFHRTEQPGLNYHIPYPVERLIKVPVTVVNRVEVGLRSLGRTGSASVREVPEESLMLTGDKNIVDIHFEVQWKINNAKDFLFNVHQPEATVKSVSESAMREVVGRTPITDALAEGKFQIQNESRALLQQTLDDYGAGIQVMEVQMRKVDPPGSVIDAFRDVETADADRERMINQAETYRNDIIPRARGEAERVVQEAEAYRGEIVARAQGEASRFSAVYDEYRRAKDVTRKRIYLDTMEEVLRGVDKVLIDKSAQGSGVIPFLPLSEVKKREQ